MLIFTRKPGESLWVELGDLDPSTPVGEVFARGPIEITVLVVEDEQVKLGVEADSRFLILRSELAGILSRPGGCRSR